MEIAPAKKESVEEVLRLCTKLWREHQGIDPNFTLHPDIQNTQRRWLREAVSSRDALVLIVKEGERLVATGTATVSKSKIFWPERYGYIRDVYVEEDYRGRGVGSALTENLIEWFKHKEVTWIELVALTKNAAANIFWQECGFTSIFNIYRRNIE